MFRDLFGGVICYMQCVCFGEYGASPIDCSSGIHEIWLESYVFACREYVLAARASYSGYVWEIVQCVLWYASGPCYIRACVFLFGMNFICLGQRLDSVGPCLSKCNGDMLCFAKAFGMFGLYIKIVLRSSECSTDAFGDHILHWFDLVSCASVVCVLARGWVARKCVASLRVVETCNA